MAEVTRVLREVQLDTEGGLVTARGSVPLYSRRRSKFVKDDSAAVGATKADRVARNKDVGSFIGVNKTELANKKAAGTSMVKAASWSDFADFAVTKADVGNKEAAGTFTGEIGVTKADEAAGTFTGEIGVTKAEPGNKEAAGSVTGEIGITKAVAGNKEAGEIFVTKAEVGNKEAAGKGVITEKAWVEFVFLTKPPAGIELKTEPTGALITKEMVPDSFIEILKERHLFQKLPPITFSGYNNIHSKYPRLRDLYLTEMTRRNYCVDLHADVLEQLKDQGFAEVGVDFTDGVKKIFILPKNQRGCAP